MGRKGSGVEVRAASIRLTFTVGGVSHKQTFCIDGVPIPPTPANQKYALRLAMEIRDRIAAGAFVMGDYFPHAVATAHGQTVKDALDTFLSCKMAEKSTLNGYMSASRFWSAEIGAKHVKSLKHSDILIALKKRPMLSGKTVSNYVSVLRAAIDLMVMDRVLASNPVGVIDVPYQKPEVDPFSQDEAEEIITDMRKHYHDQVGNYIEAKFFTGMRTSESFGLKWSSVDLRSGKFVVSDVVVAREDKTRTKTGVSRLVLMNSRAKSAFDSQREHTFMRPEGHVFMDPRKDRPWTAEQFFTRFFWTPTLRRLKIRYRPPYTTRHTYATMMLMAGMKPAFCAKQLGHDVRVFLTTYSRWMDGSADAVEMQRLEAAISPGSSPAPLKGAASD